MVLSTQLELRQTQTLVITPQLQQAIRLLQLSNLELQAFLEHEIEQNPFVEWDDTPGEDGERAGNGAAGAHEAQAGDGPLENGAGGLQDFAEPATSPAVETLDDGIDPVESSFDLPSAGFEGLSMRSASGAATKGSESWMEDCVAQQVGLRDHLASSFSSPHPIRRAGWSAST